MPLCPCYASLRGRTPLWCCPPWPLTPLWSLCLQCTSACQVKDPYLWWRLEEQVLAGWAVNPAASEAELFDTAVQQQLGISGATAVAKCRDLHVAVAGCCGWGGAMVSGVAVPVGACAVLSCTRTVQTLTCVPPSAT